MSCQVFEEMIALLAGDDLGAPEVERLEAHLRDCEPCRQFAADMRRSRRAVASLAAVPVDEAVLAGVRTGVLGEIERSEDRPATVLSFPAGGWQRRLAWAAALVVALGAAILLRSGWDRTPAERPGESPAPAPMPQIAETPPAPPATVPEPVAVEPAPAPPIVHVPEPVPAPLVAESVVVASAPPPVGPTAPRVAVAPALAPAAAEPTFIKLVSEEADLVIYWQVNPPVEAAKEKTHETSAV
ncbi:MAG: hypothetical protein GY719_02520 [bacterium]|nr:hypothetical protein [bacterium]